MEIHKSIANPKNTLGGRLLKDMQAAKRARIFRGFNNLHKYEIIKNILT